MTFDLVIGAGPLGRTVAKHLQSQGHAVKLATRSGAAVDLRLDLLQAASFTGDLRGLRTLFVCSAPAYSRWPQELPPMVDGALALAARHGVPLVFADNLYAYGAGAGPMTEATPYRATGPKGLARRAVADRLMAAHAVGGARTAIVRASDFYGPGVGRSILSLDVFRAVMAGKPAHCLGNPQLPHTLTYIDDFARALVRVGQAPQAHGQVWHAPSAAPCSMQGMVEIIARQCGTAPRLRTAPRWLLKAVGLFNAEWREMDEVYDQYEQPWVMDSSKYQQHFGDAPTSHETAIRQTLAALR